MLGGGTETGAEGSAVGTASQNSGVRKAFGVARGVGATGGVGSVSTHRSSSWKTVGERGRKETSKAGRLAITTWKKVIAGKVGGSKQRKKKAVSERRKRK